MISVWDSHSYKDFVREWVGALPSGGRGEYKKMADAIGVSAALLSQVMSGEKDLSPEAALNLCKYMNLSEQEIDQFMLLVERDRAGSEALRDRLARKIDEGRLKADALAQRVSVDQELSASESAQYYSAWWYTALPHLVACQPKWSAEALAYRLGVPKKTVHKILPFLLDLGILVRLEEGTYGVGVRRTFIPSSSPLVISHHRNWRTKGFSQMPFANVAEGNDLFFTAPMSCSEELARKIRHGLLQLIENLTREIGDSPSETVRCLNIDYFEW